MLEKVVVKIVAAEERNESPELERTSICEDHDVGNIDISVMLELSFEKI